MAKDRNQPWTPPGHDLGALVSGWNPWWRDSEVPETFAPQYERPVVSTLTSRLQDSRRRRFHLVVGPRRVGKTTAMYQVVRHLLKNGVDRRRVRWLRMDHPYLIELPLGEIVQTWCKDRTPEDPLFLFVDELCYGRQWDLWLKTMYDEQWPVELIATSSATADLRKGVVESGVGRWEEHYLGPFLLGEELRLTQAGLVGGVAATGSLQETARALHEEGLDFDEVRKHRGLLLGLGGFPEAIQAHGGLLLGDFREGGPDPGVQIAAALQMAEESLRADAVEKVVYKDIPQAFGIDNPMLLERVLYALAARICTVLSPNSVCQEIHGLNSTTFERYLGFLDRSSLVYTLPNYSGADGARNRKGRKVYFVDGAVRNAALQRGFRAFMAPEEEGLLIENLVAAHLQVYARVTGHQLFHWRHKDSEVDFVLVGPDERVGIEVGRGRSHGRTGMRRFLDVHAEFSSSSYQALQQETLLVEPDPERGTVGRMPLDLLLLALSIEVEGAT